MPDSRREVLQAVREALGERSRDRLGDYNRISREYAVSSSFNRAEALELFEDRLRDYDCVTHRCESGNLPAAIGRSLQACGRSRIVIAEDFPPAWLPEGFTFLRDESLSYAELDSVDGVLTACSVAIALTGTIILQEGAIGQGRRVLSLLPDYHLCIVDADQIVQTVPEGMRAIESTSARATTTISGPSATADIEMTRIRGVHGPRMLEVIIVMPEQIRPEPAACYTVRLLRMRRASVLLSEVIEKHVVMRLDLG